MSEEKKFEAKNIESAINQACEFFDKDRESLDIQIVDAGSSGIFGLGGRKAIIKVKPSSNNYELRELVQNVIHNLLTSIIENPSLDIQVDGDRVNVAILDQENSGLIIGKEGQNISALEYLANRIVARSWPEKVYVQLDAGGYRDKQEENVRQKALELAEKVKKTGKALSTRPMSAYHRRIVHMTLQEDAELITRSKGDGPMKRVLIMKKRKRRPRPRKEAE